MANKIIPRIEVVKEQKLFWLYIDDTRSNFLAKLTVGIEDGHRELYLTIKKNKEKHFLRVWRGYAINKDLLNTTQSKFKRIKIIEKDNGSEKTYISSKDNWKNKGIEHKNEMYPYDVQIILPLKDFDIKGNVSAEKENVYIPENKTNDTFF